MTEGVHIGWLSDGRRLHMRHGPIDLIVEVQGSREDEQAAIGHAASRFPQILPALVQELEFLRTPIAPDTPAPIGCVARSMVRAAKPHAPDHFVTPMIAVAGSVADYVLKLLTTDYSLTRAYVNNGGDIALYLGAGQTYDIAVCDNVELGGINSTLRLDAASGIGGIATSGWQGRSHSLGIADAVTVLARDAANADAAATLIANAVDVPQSPRVTRVASCSLLPDSDLGDLPVTVEVGALTKAEIDQALNKGVQAASRMLDKGQITGVMIALQGCTKVLGSAVRTQRISA